MMVNNLLERLSNWLSEPFNLDVIVSNRLGSCLYSKGKYNVILDTDEIVIKKGNEVIFQDEILHMTYHEGVLYVIVNS